MGWEGRYTFRHHSRLYLIVFHDLFLFPGCDRQTDIYTNIATFRLNRSRGRLSENVAQN